MNEKKLLSIISLFLSLLGMFLIFRELGLSVLIGVILLLWGNNIKLKAENS